MSNAHPAATISPPISLTSFLTLRKNSAAGDDLPAIVTAEQKAALITLDRRLEAELRPPTLGEVTRFLSTLSNTIPRGAPKFDGVGERISQAQLAQVAVDYHDAICDRPAVALEPARKALIRTKTFFPSAAEVRVAMMAVPVPQAAQRARIWHLMRCKESEDGPSWAMRIRGFQVQGTWAESWGARPGDPGCAAPGVLLAACGYAVVR